MNDHWLVGLDAYGERCCCGVVARRILEHLRDVALAELKEAA
jgi:hypothetical protein